MNWQHKILSAFPKASGPYVASIRFGATEQAMIEAGITKNPLRMAHFFATIGVESGDMTLTRENMNYSKKRITEIFGVGKHSAAITAAEAAGLAGNPAKLAERVYGLGNSRKATELGNTSPGDGYKYRGTGPFQLTGRRSTEKAMLRLGAETVEDLLSPLNLIRSAVLFWTDNKLNELADRDDSRALRKRVNGGYNGYAEFVRLKDKLLKLLDPNSDTSANPDLNVMQLQADLHSLGYPLTMDGQYGPKTTDAVKAFQRANGLKVDGIAGEATLAVIKLRLESTGPLPVSVDDREAEHKTQTTGAGIAGLGAVGEMVMGVAREIGAIGIDSPIIRVIPPVLLLIGGALVIWPMLKRKS